MEGFKNKSDVDDDKRNKIVASMQEKQSVEIFANWLAEKKERDTYPEKNMRIDKLLKVLMLIKRRTVANEMADEGL